jgi:hypothetical protein
MRGDDALEVIRTRATAVNPLPVWRCLRLDPLAESRVQP